MKLSLYHYQGCSFCHLGRRTIDRLDLEVEQRDILESSERRRELVAATGGQTVPCLRIESEDGDVEWKLESRDIIDYLQHLVASSR
ncbi:MAG: glutaredoxin [Myxococcota bacterium]|nr:glutaredoxin [Myxococcota bacterium]